MRTLFAYTYDAAPGRTETDGECYARLAAAVRAWADENGAIADEIHDPAADLIEARVAGPDPADATARRTTDVAVARTAAPPGLQVSVREGVALSRFVLRPAWFEVRRPPVLDRLLAVAAGTIGPTPIPTAPRRLYAPFVPGFVDGDLLEPRRALPTVTVTPSLGLRRPHVDPAVLQHRLLGLAAVVELADAQATFKLTEKVGKDLSCFNGAVRVYWPGFTADADPVAHPLYFPDAMQHRGRAVEDVLFNLLAGAAGFRFAEAPLVQIARDAAARRRQADVQKRVQDLAAGAAEQDQILAALQATWDENADLKRQVRELTAELADQKKAWNQYRAAEDPAEAEDAEARPDAFRTVAEVVEFARAGFKDTLHFLPSAEAAAAKSPYEHPDRVAELFDALDALVRKWRDPEGLGTDWFRALAGYGFEFKPHISDTARTKFGREYVFLYGGEYHVFENHITLGTGPPRSCISVHWFRDDRRKRLAVGWCGNHLSNTMS